MIVDDLRAAMVANGVDGTFKVVFETQPGVAQPVAFAEVKTVRTGHGHVLAQPGDPIQQDVLEASLAPGSPALTVDQVKALADAAPGNIEVLQRAGLPILEPVRLTIRRMIERPDGFYEASPNEGGWFETVVVY